MVNNHLQVSDLGERKLIERIIEKLKNSYNDSKEGFLNDKWNDFYIGDDSALIKLNNDYYNLNNNDNYLVATSDMLIEKSHFPKQMSYFQIGKKAVTVNVSDLAAMGAKPIGILINLAIPKKLKLSYFDELIDGILDACSYYKIPLVGGDTNQSDEIIISGTALGEVKKEKTLFKHGFGDGDLIAITDKIGLAALGFEIFNSQISTKLIKKSLVNHEIDRNIVDLAIQKVLNPIAKINEGMILSYFASSATDITDGLASELYELCNSNKNKNPNSKLGMIIYENKLPFLDEITKISKILKKNPLNLILHTGEDFELLFTINKDNLEKLYELNKIKKNKFDFFDFYIIGEINNKNKVEIKHINGSVKELSSKGYEHLVNNKLVEVRNDYED
ncbi:MAG: thiamine-phosphate kinase [Methanobacteriaceae archaeon]|jgi:thiamine-monophosphate kinase|nr:thiamine-phosphate kinase [Candidatus Methanorudis spinitermitis]